jgi:hypothetical protein
MGRILTLLLGLLVVAGVTYYVVQQTALSAGAGPSTPRRQLDTVREKAKDIERDAQKRADDLLKKSE